MSLGTIGRVMHTSRKRMLTMDVEQSAADFSEKFGMHIGDIVEAKRWSRRRGGAEPYWVKARICEVSSCYYNANGGWTAHLKVLPINVDGSLGCSRHVSATIDKRGRFGSGPIDQIRPVCVSA